MNEPPIFPERLSHVYSAIAQELERLGATTLYTTETRELFGRNIEVPITGLSAATQNIILLRHIEHRATMLRVMAILKVRDDAYDGRMRELQITDTGLVLLDTFAAESQVASGGGFSSDARQQLPRGKTRRGDPTFDIDRRRRVRTRRDAARDASRARV